MKMIETFGWPLVVVITILFGAGVFALTYFWFQYIRAVFIISKDDGLPIAIMKVFLPSIMKNNIQRYEEMKSNPNDPRHEEDGWTDYDDNCVTCSKATNSSEGVQK